MTQNCVKLAKAYPDFVEEKQTKFLYLHEQKNAATGKNMSSVCEETGVKNINILLTQAEFVVSMYTLGKSFLLKVSKT